MTETLKYTVINKENEFEHRQYAEHIKAEVTIESTSYRAAVREAFNSLAAYIFGNNISAREIAMTTPVTTTQSEKIAMTTPVTTTQSEKIAMTTPVTTTQSEKIAMTTPVSISGEGTYTVAFIMPSKYTLSSLPLPGNQQVKLTPVPSHQAAVIRFNGYFNEEKIVHGKQLLTEWIRAQGLNPTGEFTVAGYNPPWVPGFLARNEVLISVE